MILLLYFGGAEEDRTPDLRIANPPLNQHISCDLQVPLRQLMDDLVGWQRAAE